MRSDQNDNKDWDPVGEMAIVDTFTRLIFREESDLGPCDRAVIEAFRSVDPNVFTDSHAEMGDYLRSLGVREMIHLVARIRATMAAQARENLAALDGPAPTNPPGLRRH